MLDDLQQITSSLIERISKYKALDCELPEEFKAEFLHVRGNDQIVYGKHTALVTNEQGMRIHISNSWFYVAAILAPLYAPLNKYRDVLRQYVDDATLKDKNDAAIKEALDKSPLSDEDKKKLTTFATDYSSWTCGVLKSGKSLDRNDAFESPILALANVVNDSQTLIARIWLRLGEMPDMANLLNKYVDERIFNSGARYSSISMNLSLPLQQIYYGAPGTGKSHGIKKQESKFAEVIRTTFHPDSDYSTFVGAYKPTMKRTKKCVIIDKEEREITPTVTNDEYEERISYTFVKQAFLKAYIAAWKGLKDGKKILLVIEEINRGNCAQIFGDLFQLLDREESGYSSYPISADEDLHQVLEREFSEIEDMPAKVKSGEELLLPCNLHIWATMNTSDQSLFPIDSAFKRRWDWTYVPIKYEKTEWKVVLSDKCWCSWTEIQTTLNDLIYDATESEDKMLGDWFIKADEKNEITEEQLVGKIIFYLWNDVAKVDAGTLFDLEVVEKRGKNKGVTFSDFYEMGGKTNTTIVKDWLTKIGITINEAKPADDGMDDEEDLGENVPEHVSDTNMPYRVTFPDGEVISKGNGWDTYVAALRKIGLDKALPYGEIFHRKNKTLPLITTKRIPDDGIYKYYDVDGYYVLSGTDSQHRLLRRMDKDLNLGLTIE